MKAITCKQTSLLLHDHQERSPHPNLVSAWRNYRGGSFQTFSMEN
jgi:hypothetical protein